MGTFDNIQENMFFDNGRTNLHIKKVPQSYPNDNPTGFHQ